MITGTRKRKDGTTETFEAGVCAGEDLMSALRKHGIYLDAPCSGRGLCGRCRVRFAEGAPDPVETERRFLTREELAAGVRLACATVPRGDCRIELPDEGQEEIAALSGGEGPAGAGKCAGGRPASPHGIAVDLGTTTLAMALVETATGSVLKTVTGVNHQRAFGADVISRIQAANEGGGELLRQSILRDLKQMAAQLLAKTHTPPEAVGRIVIAGNTTMCHLLRGLSCETLGVWPFTPVDLSMWRGTYRELFCLPDAGDSGMELPDIPAEVIILPGISAFVGGDIVAGLYGCGLHRKKETSFYLDIGTNGEMAVGNSSEILVTSAAAGPVFEGGNLSCGVPGIPGAISHVTISGQEKEFGTLSWKRAEAGGKRVGTGGTGTAAICVETGGTGAAAIYETIGGREPVGLCGSGVTDLLSGLVRAGIVDENGELSEPWAQEGFPVVSEQIRFTQRDIREIQMGKSAIRAGIETLAAEYAARSAIPAVSAASVPFYLAGGFGYALDVPNAVQIGLLPEWCSEKICLCGNSSLTGAVRWLCAEGAEKEVKDIVEKAVEISLALHPQFQELYLEHMFF